MYKCQHPLESPGDIRGGVLMLKIDQCISQMNYHGSEIQTDCFVRVGMKLLVQVKLRAFMYKAVQKNKVKKIFRKVPLE